MEKMLTLGDLYISDFINEGETPRGGKHELALVFDEESSAVKIANPPKINEMYGKYWYRSGINNTMKNELNSIVNSILKITKLYDNDIWLDIASNDGTLLSFVPKNLIRVGIDPCDDSFKIEAEEHSDLIIQDYFSAEGFKKSRFGNLKAKVVTTIAMFYDLETPKNFINDLKEILDDDGIWVIQLSYTPLMLKQLAFDNICHEHIFYYSLFNIEKLFKECGLDIMDAQLNDVNGGSFRVYAMKNEADKSKFGTQPYRDVAKFRVNSLLNYEKTLNLDKKETWVNFFNEIESLKNKLVSFIKTEKSNGKSIWGYGASTKGNTLLQYFELDNSLIDGIAEKNHQKWGLKTVGTNIPIFSEKEMRETKPDYLLVLPWHFINEFTIREDEYLKNGGTFIVPCPKFKLINYKNE